MNFTNEQNLFTTIPRQIIPHEVVLHVCASSMQGRRSFPLSYKPLLTGL